MSAKRQRMEGQLAGDEWASEPRDETENLARHKPYKGNWRAELRIYGDNGLARALGLYQIIDPQQNVGFMEFWQQQVFCYDRIPLSKRRLANIMNIDFAQGFVEGALQFWAIGEALSRRAA